MNLSPYKFAKVLSSELGRTIPPQMVYNYIGKGKIHAEVNELGKKYLTETEQARVLEMLTKTPEGDVEVEV